MRLILSFLIFAVFGFAQQNCQNDKAANAGKTETATTDAKSAANSQNAATRSAGAPNTADAAQTDGAARISVEEAKKAFDANDAVFVDTRAESAYQVEHIKGAINIPAEAFKMRYKEVPTGKKIIAYCS